MNNLLLTEKWRPKVIEDLVLPERISNIFQNGVTQNYIFTGHYGTGKTSLARILIGKYSKDKPFLELNSSFDTSIDVLRGVIEDFCSTVYMGLDSQGSSDIKYVFLDEFEKVSISFQEAMKGFVEKYHKVRFILSTNHIEKVSPALKSRISIVNFNPQNQDEEKFIKRGIYKKLSEQILPKEETNISKDDLIKIINKSYPDIRSMIRVVEDYKISGGDIHSLASNIDSKIIDKLFEIIFNGSSYDDTYHFLMNNFGAERVYDLIGILGRPLILKIFSDHKELSNKLFEANYIIADYASKLETNTDPIILGMTIIGKMQNIFAK